MTVGILEVWRQPDGFWRWRYRNPRDGTDLISNEAYPDRGGAVLAARTAYPAVREVRVERPRPSLGRWLRRLAMFGLIVWLPRKLWSLLKAMVKVGVAARVLPSLLKRARGAGSAAPRVRRTR